jgi:hypothetical protein
MPNAMASMCTTPSQCPLQEPARSAPPCIRIQPIVKQKNASKQARWATRLCHTHMRTRERTTKQKQTHTSKRYLNSMGSLQADNRNGAAASSCSTGKRVTDTTCTVINTSAASSSARATAGSRSPMTHTDGTTSVRGWDYRGDGSHCRCGHKWSANTHWWACSHVREFVAVQR